MVKFTEISAPAPLCHSPLYGLEDQMVKAASAGLIIREIWPFVATQIAWGKQDADLSALAQALGVKTLPTHMDQGVTAGRAGALILPLMPRRVLRVHTSALSQAAAKTIADLGAYTLDMTHGRTRLSLKGPHWRWTLMKGCGIDFETLGVGQVVHSDIFKISTLLWVVSDDEAQMLTPYTYARALVEKIIDARL